MKKPSSTRVPGYPATLGGFLTPPVLWALYFVFIYGTHGVICAEVPVGQTGAGTDLSLPLIIGGATLAMLIAHVAVGILAYGRTRQLRKRHQDRENDTRSGQSYFLAYATVLNAALFGLATLWIGIPTLMLQPCL